MKEYRPHPFRKENKATIHSQWEEIRYAKCPIEGSTIEPIPYRGVFVEYTFTNKKGKRVYVPEYCLLVDWEVKV